MHVYATDFLEGIQTTLELSKQGQDIFSAGNGALFPNITTQAKWKYARVPKGLRLSDGHNVWHFDHSQGESTENDFPVSRGQDIPLTDFDKDATHVGLAQVHKADPSFAYFTLQEGTSNPTFTYKHEGGTKWRGIPKKRVLKKVEEKSAVFDLEPTEFLQGAVKTADVGTWATRLGQMATAFPARHPLVTALGAGALGATYDFGRRQWYNTDEENQQEDENPLRRIARVAVPALGAGAYGLLAGHLGFGGPQNAIGKNVPLPSDTQPATPQVEAPPQVEPPQSFMPEPPAAPPIPTLPRGTVPAGTPADSELWRAAGITPMERKPFLDASARPQLESVGRNLRAAFAKQEKDLASQEAPFIAQREENWTR